MNHVILGGAGFIGSHLTDSLLADGDRVLVLDNFSTGRVENLPHSHDHLHTEFVHLEKSHDWTTLAIRHFEGEVDRVWVLASPASPAVYQAQPRTTLRLGTGLVDLACSFAVLMGARLLFASSSEVYGDPRVHPQPEWYRGNVSTTGPRSCYDEAKRAGEAFCAAYAQEHQLEVRIARIFNTYGPRMRLDDGRVITNFISRCLTGQPMEVYGTGSQTRSFCYISDLVRGLRMLMEAEKVWTEDGSVIDPREPVNVGSGLDEYEIAKLAPLVGHVVAVERQMEITVEVDIIPDPIGDDPKQRCPSIERLHRLTGWAPNVRLVEGLRKTVAWALQQAEVAPADRPGEE